MKVGVLGGGQLGRMLALAGYPLGFHFRFLDSHPEAPAEPLAEFLDGDFFDPAVMDRFAEGIDLVTYEFENVPVEPVKQLARRVVVHPSPLALQTAQDRLFEKTLFGELGIPTANFLPVESLTELERAVGEIGAPSVLKTRRLGYDGKGQAVLKHRADAAAAWERLAGAGSILEAFVEFDRELSILAARGRDGRVVYYPLIENHHKEGILRLSLAPAPELEPELQRLAENHARKVLEALDYVGMLTIEFFERQGVLLANEMAPRVHNSGHWTIEGARTSQFENHLRAIAGLPLGRTHPLGRFAMYNLVGASPPLETLLAIPGSHVHLYGKAPRPGRKLGHVTIPIEHAAAAYAAVEAVSEATGAIETVPRDIDRIRRWELY